MHKSFIDRQKDSETGLGNYGLRQYDEGQGEFASIDPMWEKYPSLSPYSYAANSPVLFSDPNGDTIKWDNSMRIKDHMMIESFIKASKEGKKLWNTLVQSNRVVTMSYSGSALELRLNPGSNIGSKAHYVLSEDPENAYANGARQGLGSNATMFFNVQSLESAYALGKDNLYYKENAGIVGHEFGHARDNVQGIMMRGVSPTANDLAEEQAMVVENLIRKQLGLPTKTHYLSPDTGGYSPLSTIPRGIPVYIPPVMINP